MAADVDVLEHRDQDSRYPGLSRETRSGEREGSSADNRISGCRRTRWYETIDLKANREIVQADSRELGEACTELPAIWIKFKRARDDRVSIVL